MGTNFKDFIQGNFAFEVTEDDRRYFEKNYNSFLSAFKYYLDTGEMQL